MVKANQAGRGKLAQTAKPDHLFGRYRLVEMKALHPLALQDAQELGLGEVLDALGDQLQAERTTELDNGGKQRRRIRIGLDIGQEGAVDFQAVEREAAQVGERR